MDRYPQSGGDKNAKPTRQEFADGSAVVTFPDDPRAFGLLENLLKQHPELEYEFKDGVECCRKAVEVAAKMLRELRPLVHRGRPKQWVLLKVKMQSALRRVLGSSSK